MVEIVPVKKLSIADEITQQLLELILSGKFAPGERLPGERELAAGFNTNRNTLREAIRNLETLNLVEARQGDGMRVRDFARCGEINLVPHFLRHTLDDDARLAVIEDVLRLRRILLVEAVDAIGRRAPAGEVEAIRKLVRSQEANTDDPEKLVITDLEISQAMVVASGSLAYGWIFNTMAKLYEEVALQYPDLWVFTPNYVEALDAILEAAARRKSQRARKLMQRHLEESDRLILAAVNALRKPVD